jgi:hypothetical protein
MPNPLYKDLPMPNAELPDTNAPTAICRGKLPPDVLPKRAPASTDASAETGTVIVVGVSRDKIVDTPIF